MRHYVACNNETKNKSITINNDWLQLNGKYCCPFCNKFYTKMGICSHIILKHINPDSCKNNLSEYNKKVQNGIISHNKNQFQLAMDRGEKIFVSDETKKKLSEIKKGQTVSLATREKISIARSKFLEEVGGGGFTKIKWYLCKNIKNEEFIVRGNWEREMSELLNNENVYWIRKRYINYVKNNHNKIYIPDFYIPEYNLYVEVKGYFSQRDKEKMKLVLNQNNIKLCMIFEKDLKLIRKIGFIKYWDVSALSYTQ
jgi:hypothetical protein